MLTVTMKTRVLFAVNIDNIFSTFPRDIPISNLLLPQMALMLPILYYFIFYI